MQTTLRVPDELYEKIKENAKRKGMTVNGYILSILWETKERSRERGVKQYAGEKGDNRRKSTTVIEQ